jgi:site-specific DNA-methyltransferase (adenine-specific)
MDERKGGLVLDPYCGSGTTLVAAKILGHNYIGIDISKEYVEFAKKRLENFKDEELIAYEEIVKHTVYKTFKERKEKGEFTGKYGPKKKLFLNKP